MKREYPEGPVISVHAVILQDDKILLIRRAHPPRQGGWSVPGGVVELGETLHQAACRELLEECSLEIETADILHVADHIIPDESGGIRYHYLLIFIRACVQRGSVCPGSDATEARWVSRREFREFDLHPAAREAVQRAWRISGQIKYS